MEIEEIRKELTELLDNIVEHANKYSAVSTIPSLEVGALLTKVNRLHERMAVLRYLLEAQEKETKQQSDKLFKHDKFAEITPLEPLNVAAPTQEIPAVNAQAMEIEKAVDGSVEENASIAKEELDEVAEPQIARLVDAFSLNDRYLYANELFNKDMSAFNSLVKAIDNCSSFDAAQKLYVSFDWEIDNAHVLSFTSLVDRRFS